MSHISCLRVLPMLLPGQLIKYRSSAGSVPVSSVSEAIEDEILTAFYVLLLSTAHKYCLKHYSRYYLNVVFCFYTPKYLVLHMGGSRFTAIIVSSRIRL